ncbi:ABC transporter ATP-binding protein [Haloferax sulfurifontis]|uniref:ABC transporter ATP-binding protein n=2 Tax=Haloferax sulfurifontis TaxID=255616 RepID=A0A830DXU7_9EURY|nr:ABC transporter ATP-binding protein [Haloferax sulfurifontis]ELZ98560.1 putative branched-chain amino acids ABC transporter ATP-binding protein [Haloferax sulfurifontis ATCC BAA-897]GGC59228.1 ABC transporter ATP-binding protein [Haloferax sulfurifontis]
MTNRALDVAGVDSGYGEVQVLRDLTLHLESDEIVCIIGPNGAGKSTVLKTVFGLLKPWTGSVELSGQDITGEEPEDLVRVGMGYVPQVDNVFSSLTIDENLKMGGVARSEGLQARIDELYDQFTILDEKRSAKARTLSGGQRQVLAFARALVMEPEVLLIDEPSAGLAPNIVQSVFEDVKKVNELGTAVLMVEQNAREGLGISDRGYVLDQGTVAYEGDAAGLLDDPEVSRLYMGGADYEGVEGE